MNILKIDFKKKNISFICQTIEDLWVIKTLAEVGDTIKGSSLRRLKNNDTGESERKPIFVEIDIEKKDFSSTLNSLRFTGKIVFSKPQELAPLAEYHTIDVDFGNKYTICKKELFQHQIDLLKNSSSFVNKINVVVLDDESCDVYSLSGVEKKLIASFKSGKHGKRYNQSFDFTPFFENIFSLIEKYKDQLIVAGPGGTKTSFLKYIKEKYKLSGISVNISSTSKSSINELFTKKEVLKFFENSLIYKEQEMLIKFKENLGKDNGLSVYSLKDISLVVETGACEFILISYNLWLKEINKLQTLIKIAEKVNTKIHIVDETHDETLKTLHSFGGIISVLKYKLNY